MCGPTGTKLRKPLTAIQNLQVAFLDCVFFKVTPSKISVAINSHLAIDICLKLPLFHGLSACDSKKVSSKHEAWKPCFPLLLLNVCDEKFIK